jgi:uncharacterized protein YjdB
MTSKPSTHPIRFAALLGGLLINLLIAGGCTTDGDDDPLLEALDLAELDIESLTVSATNTVVAPERTVQFTATGRRPDNSTRDVTEAVRWSSSEPAVATIDGTGLVATRAIGTTTITAQVGNLADRLDLTVSDADVQSLDLSQSPTQTEACRNLALVANGSFADGTSRDVTEAVQWQSDNTTIARFAEAPAGQLQTRAPGSTTVTATLDNVTADPLAITVAGVPQGITIAPDIDTLAVGATETFTAEGRYNGEREDITANVTWGSEPENGIIRVDPDGSVTPQGTGSATVTATCAGIVAREDFTVAEAATLTRIEINDGDPFITLDRDATTQLEAEAIFSDGSREDITDDASWSTTDQGDEAVSVDDDDNKGEVTGDSLGIGVVEAEYQGATDDITIQVEDPDSGV